MTFTEIAIFACQCMVVMDRREGFLTGQCINDLF